MKLSKLFLAITLATSSVYANDELWEGTKARHFGDRVITQVDDVTFLDVQAPERAYTATHVPITIVADSSKYKVVYLFVDNNPVQHVATFNLTDHIEMLRLHTRIRVETNSNIRLIGETHDGKLHMDYDYTKASGGCSAYVDFTSEILYKDIGRIRTKQKDGLFTTHIKHPQFTGLQKDLDRGGTIPRYLVESVTWTNENGDIVLSATTDMSISMNPFFNLEYDKPLSVSVIDTKGDLYE